MATASLPSPGELKGLETDRPITDPALPNKAIEVEGGSSLSETVGPFTFSGSAAVAAKVAIINSRDDEDPTGIVALKGSSTDELEGAQVANRVPFQEGTGYICLVGFTAGVKAAAGGSLGDLGITFKGAAEVALGCVRNFPGDVSVHAALADTFAHFPTFLSVEDVLALGANDAVAYSFNGSLGLTLKVELSDFAGSLAAAAERIVAAAGQGVKIKSGVSLTGKLAMQDSFRLVATNATEGRTRIAVRKEHVRSAGFDSAAGIDVKFDPAEMLKALDALTESVFGYPWTALESLLDKGVAQLDDDERARVEEILEQSGREKFEDALNLSEYKKIIAGLRDALTKELRQTFAAKWTFNYSRITSEAALLQAVLDADALRTFHRDLLGFQLAGLLADDARGVEVEVFLAKKTKTIKFEYGLTLSWGDFTLAAGKAISERTWVTLTDRKGSRKASFLGQRGYTSTWLGEKSAHAVSFGATMPGFSPADPLRAIDYELGLSLRFTWDDVRFDDESVLEIADHAAVVGAIGPDDMDETLAALRDIHAVRKSAKGSAIVHLQVDNDLLVQLLAVIAGPARVDLTALALGGALGYRKEQEYSLRQSVTARAQAYGPVFKTYLQEEEMDARDVARTAWSVLSNQHKRLATAEYNFVEANGDRAWSAGAMVMLHSGTYPFRDTIKSLWLGLEALHARAQNGASDRVIETAYGHLKETWEDHYPTRAFAVLLVEAARRVPKGLERLQRRLEVNAGGTKVAFARGSSE